MKMTIAKLKKSIIAQKVIAGILTSSIALFSAAPAYAGTAVDQESLYPILKTSTQEYLYPVTGTTGTIYRYTTISDVLSQFAEQSTLNQKSIYTLMNTIGGYVDGIEGYIDGIEGYIDGIEGQITTSNTHLNAIKGYVDTLETLVTTSNTHLNAIKGYVDGIEGKIDTSNTRLNDIKNEIQNITTYNYSQVLSDIFTNTGYLSTIDTYTQSIQDSIGYGTTGDNVLSKLTSIVNSNSNIDSHIVSLSSEYVNNQQISTPIQERSTVTGTLSATSKTTPLLVRFLSRSGNSPYKSLESVNGTLTLYDYFHILNNNLIGVNTAIVTTGTSYNYRYYNDDLTTDTRTVASVMDMLMMFSGDMSKFVSRMSYMIADPDTISAKQANKNQEQAVLTNFTGQGSASASASDFGELSNAVGSVKSGLNTNASPSDVLTVFNSNDGFGWFSQATLDELDTTTQNTRHMKAGSDTPLYDSNYNAIMDYLTGGDRK